MWKPFFLLVVMIGVQESYGELLNVAPTPNICGGSGGSGGVVQFDVGDPAVPCLQVESTFKRCLGTIPKEPRLQYDGCKKYLFYNNCLVTWDNAQRVCEARGGRLWEPADETEYEQLFTAIKYDDSGESIKPKYLVANTGLHWYIGLRNEDADGSGAGSTARYASSGLPVTWRTMTESDLAQDCVDIFNDKSTLGDHACDDPHKFICEITDCCQCRYEGQTYEPDTLITVIPHSCTHVYCDHDANVVLQNMPDKYGNAATNCCLYNNYLTMPNCHTYDKRQFCCDGELIQTYPYYELLPPSQSGNQIPSDSKTK